VYGPFNYPLNETFTDDDTRNSLWETPFSSNPPSTAHCSSGRFLKRSGICFPRGVVNTIYGEGRTIIGPLISSEKIDVLALIGSARRCQCYPEGSIRNRTG